jgi:GTP-binding protein HflX
VRKLPHHLVEAFRSTLEVVAESDLLVHVVDASAVDPDAQIDAVRTVLAEIGAGDVPELLVYNKIDKAMIDVPWGAVAISALTGEGVDKLLRTIADRLRAIETVIELLVPYDRGDVLAALHREGEVLVEAHEEDATRLRARLDRVATGKFAPFRVER